MINMMLLFAILLLLLTSGSVAFEVPFPLSSDEIRGSIISSSPSNGPTIPVTTQQLLLGSGTKAEVMSCFPSSTASGGGDDFFSSLLGMSMNSKKQSTYDKPVLAFLHGSFHASWCWGEKFMPYFASLGYPCVAFSLQGTGGTPTVEEGAKKVKIASHVADLDAFLRGLSDAGDGDGADANNSYTLGFKLGENPQIVLLGHSFGGLTIMKWLEHYYEEKDTEKKKDTENDNVNLKGVALLCSVPPSGNGKMTMRFLRRSFRQSWIITVGFVLKKAITDKTIARDLFFGGVENDNGVSDEDIERYQSYFKRDTVATIDLSDLAKKLPSAKACSGRAPFVDRLPPSLVIAAREDFIVDEEGSIETSRYLGLDGPAVVDSPHDIMLGDKWNNGATAILEWIEKL